MISYRLVFMLLSPVILIHLCWKSLQLKSLCYFKQRIGYGTKPMTQKPVWFHCASVGETNMVLPLLRELHKREPKLQFIVTTNTATSASIIIDQNKPYIRHAYLPLDWKNTTKRFIDKMNPLALFIVETELWPTLIEQTNLANIDICIINARLSSKTTDTNRWMASIYRKTLKNIKHIH